MPMKNSLNVSELLKRLGVVGDSQASADLLDQIRLGITIADLSPLVPPVSGPVAGAWIFGNAIIAEVVGWNLQCVSPGGLHVTTIATDSPNNDINTWVTDVQPFPTAAMIAPKVDFAFGQPSLSVFRGYATGPAVAPGAVLQLPDGTASASILSDMFPPKNWIGPGQFLNFETRLTNNDSTLYITWEEFPGMVNP